MPAELALSTMFLGVAAQEDDHALRIPVRRFMFTGDAGKDTRKIVRLDWPETIA
jgi:hypothetical protein